MVEFYEPLSHLFGERVRITGDSLEAKEGYVPGRPEVRAGVVVFFVRVESPYADLLTYPLESIDAVERDGDVTTLRFTSGAWLKFEVRHG